MTHGKYETPMIETVAASDIVELMGPVACGSGAGLDPLPASGDVGTTVSGGGGAQNLN